MRRGEVLKLRWIDVDLEEGTSSRARSRKQSRRKTETVRRIDLHPELKKKKLLAWRLRRPRGQFVICDADTLAFLAKQRPVQPLLLAADATHGTGAWTTQKDWFKVGFHAYRHSFASNCAAAGVDQRVIDEFMGHTTEAMHSLAPPFIFSPETAGRRLRVSHWPWGRR